MLTRVKLVAVRKESRVMRWTITTECGVVVARFESAEEAWADSLLRRVPEFSQRALRRGDGLRVLEFRICFDGVEVVRH